MTSIYDALQRARQGAGQDGRPLPGEAGARRPSEPLPGRGPGPLAAELTPLLAAVRPLLETRGAVLHFVAAAAGEGTSRVAREFALLAATTGRRRTLLIDAVRGERSTARHFKCDVARGLVDGAWIGFEESELRREVTGTSLSVACLVGERGSGPPDAATLSGLYQQLRNQFELVVIDCPAMERGEYATLLPDEADGIFLVIRAEGTRPAAIVHAKSIVEQAGGRFLGAVFNGRRNYIPEFLYRLL
ncbi:MAG: hypothetical protein JO032_18875 [Alphaproteobacteria bacterium]|nr:hypothetical protein [Alphaproteobacteria bacterium]